MVNNRTLTKWDTRYFTGVPIELRPPVFIFSISQRLVINGRTGRRVSKVESVLGSFKGGDVPITTEAGMKHFVSPVIVLKPGSERVLCFDRDFPFVAFTGPWHQLFLNAV